MQHNFKIGEREFIAVGLPGGATRTVGIGGDGQSAYYYWHKNDQLITGGHLSYFIFEWPSCTEEEAASVVESPMGHYKNYNPKETDYSDLWLKTAKESLASKFEAEGIYTVNPFGKYVKETDHSDNCYCNNCYNTFKQWQQAQERVSEKYLIIEKIKI